MEEKEIKIDNKSSKEIDSHWYNSELVHFVGVGILAIGIGFVWKMGCGACAEYKKVVGDNYSLDGDNVAEVIHYKKSLEMELED